MFFNRGMKFNSFQSFVILNETINLLRGGAGITYTLRLLGETKSGNVQLMLLNMEAEIRNSVSIPDVFRKYGLIRDDEYSILQGNNNLYENLQYILKSREVSSGFEKKILEIFALPHTIAVLLSAFIALKAYPLKSLVETEVDPFVQRIFHVKNAIELPFYIENPFYAWFFLFLVIALPGAIVGFYVYSRKFNISLHYKIFPKAYDDLPKIFRMIDVLSKNGKNQRMIARELADFAHPIGLRKVFAYVASGQGKHFFHESFRANNLPKDVCSILENYENTGALQQVIDEENETTGAQWLNEYTSTQSKTKNLILDKYVKPAVQVLYYSLAIWLFVITAIPLGKTLMFFMTFMNRF